MLERKNPIGKPGFVIGRPVIIRRHQSSLTNAPAWVRLRKHSGIEKTTTTCLTSVYPFILLAVSRGSLKPPRDGNPLETEPPPLRRNRNGTARTSSLRMPRIVPSNRRLRFDGPPFPVLAIGGAVSFVASCCGRQRPHANCYTATSAAPSRHRQGAGAVLRCHRGDLVIAARVLLYLMRTAIGRAIKGRW
jgi:hypothetical protein